MALSVAQLYEVMTQLPDPVFILSEDGHYIEYIGGVEQQSYQDGNPLIGKRLFDVLPADKAFWVMEQVARALASGRCRWWSTISPPPRWRASMPRRVPRECSASRAR